MNTSDEELQRKIESGNNTNADDLDVKAYQEVFARLRKDPGNSLSMDFADKVIVKVLEKQHSGASRDFVWFGVGVFLLIVALGAAAFLSGFKPNIGFLKNISAYGGVFAFGVAFILLLNRLEKKFLPGSE